MPVISQTSIQPGTSQSGLGDITQSFFFSPRKPGAGGLIWGVGPVLFLPTGTDPALSARKWAAGPMAVLLKQDGPWTVGMLANHIWAGGGDSNRPNVSNTFIQPFLSYTTKDAWTYGINTESTYEWNTRQWSVPVNMTVTQLLKVGGQALTLQAGARYWADTPDTTGPKGWGIRLTVNLLFPK